MFLTSNISIHHLHMRSYHSISVFHSPNQNLWHKCFEFFWAYIYGTDRNFWNHTRKKANIFWIRIITVIFASLFQVFSPMLFIYIAYIWWVTTAFLFVTAQIIILEAHVLFLSYTSIVVTLERIEDTWILASLEKWH